MRCQRGPGEPTPIRLGRLLFCLSMVEVPFLTLALSLARERECFHPSFLHSRWARGIEYLTLERIRHPQDCGVIGVSQAQAVAFGNIDKLFQCWRLYRHTSSF